MVGVLGVFFLGGGAVFLNLFLIVVDRDLKMLTSFNFIFQP